MLEVVEYGSQVLIGRANNYREVVSLIKDHLSSDYSDIQVVTVDIKPNYTRVVAICHPSLDSFSYEVYPA